MHYHPNYTYLPSIITPFHNHKQLKSFFINNTLNLTTSPPSKSEHIPYNKNEIKHYYITKLKSSPTPSDFHSSILSTLQSKSKIKKRIIDSSSSSSFSSNNTKEIQDEIIDMLIPQQTKYISIDDEYNAKNIDKETKKVLKSELIKASSKMNAMNTVKGNKTKKMTIARMRMSVEYRVSNTESKSENKKPKKEGKLFGSIHDLNFVSKLYLSHQNPILQINREAAQVAMLKDTKIMSNFLLDNFKRIYQ